MFLRSEWIVCPNGCLKTFVKGGAAPEWLENQWNQNCNMALASDAADTPFDEYFDANKQIQESSKTDADAEPS